MALITHQGERAGLGLPYSGELKEDTCYWFKPTTMEVSLEHGENFTLVRAAIVWWVGGQVYFGSDRNPVTTMAAVPISQIKEIKVLTPAK